MTSGFIRSFYNTTVSLVHTHLEVDCGKAKLPLYSSTVPSAMTCLVPPVHGVVQVADHGVRGLRPGSPTPRLLAVSQGAPGLRVAGLCAHNLRAPGHGIHGLRAAG